MEQAKGTGKKFAVNSQYFSGTQASLFIGDVWVDDIVEIDYSVQNSQVPIYGYGSQHFDFVAKGAILVSGSFAINFREPNYLWLILDRYKNFDATGSIYNQKYKKSTEDAFIKETYPQDLRKRFDFFFQTNSKDVGAAQEMLIEQAREFNGVPEDNSVENFNHRSFDILLGYGEELGPESVGETIKSVQIVGKSKIINADGRAIQEQYNFIARKIV